MESKPMARPYQQAAKFLRGVLENGPLLSQQAWEQAQQAGYSKRTYMRARKFLRVQAKRQGWGGQGRWLLSLPPAKIRPLNVQVDLQRSAMVTQLEHAPEYLVHHYRARIRA